MVLEVLRSKIRIALVSMTWLLLANAKSVTVLNGRPVRLVANPVVPASTSKMDPSLAFQKAVLPSPRLHFVTPGAPGAGFYNSPQVQTIERSSFFGGFVNLPTKSLPTSASMVQIFPLPQARNELRTDNPPRRSAAPMTAVAQGRSADDRFDNFLEADDEGYIRPEFKVYDAVPGR